MDTLLISELSARIRSRYQNGQQFYEAMFGAFSFNCSPRPSKLGNRRFTVASGFPLLASICVANIAFFVKFSLFSFGVLTGRSTE